jgi:hypothetical protein
VRGPDRKNGREKSTSELTHNYQTIGEEKTYGWCNEYTGVPVGGCEPYPEDMERCHTGDPLVSMQPGIQSNCEKIRLLYD